MSNLAVFNGVAFVPSGGFAAPAAGATIEIRRKDTGVLAAIFSDEPGAVPLTNPSAFADSNGRFTFYAAGLLRGYTAKVTLGAFTYTIDNVPVGTAAQVDAAAFGATLINAASQAAALAILGVSAGVPAFTPGGRLTLTTAVPITTADVTAATTVRYTPYLHDKIQLYDGTTWAIKQFAELSQATTDNTKSPAAVANNSNYDLFVWDDVGTLRCTRGPAWTSDTARGTGAGTTELEQFEGRNVNKIAITNGPAARRGLYVGSVRSDGSAQINDSLLKRHVWNNYNRVNRALAAVEATATWTYQTATWRQARASAANQVDVLTGLVESFIRVWVTCSYDNSAGATTAANVGVGVGVTNADSSTARAPGRASVNAITSTHAEYHAAATLGRQFYAWLERSVASGTTDWYGVDIYQQSGIFGQVFQ